MYCPGGEFVQECRRYTCGTSYDGLDYHMLYTGDHFDALQSIDASSQVSTVEPVCNGGWF